ncbi:MAG: prephenate dehydrogenase [Acidobacteriaceae bacterium]|nr:prephenate dehydrogenase [Acidobacteriaceae bacterium]
MQQITIVGTGSIGGSVALGLRKYGFSGRIVGCDRQSILDATIARGAIDTGIVEPEHAVRGSDVVVLATPVGAIIDYIERLGPVLPPQVLLTDVGSTKREILARARAVFGDESPHRFLAGHPMAGRERHGIDYADADMFKSAVWLVTPQNGQDIHHGTAGEYLGLIAGIVGKIVCMDADDHDRVCAWISHLPQMVSTALAGTVADELGNDPALMAIGGRALREMTRTAASSYSMWRDIALTNADNIEQAIQRLEQHLTHIRENLKTGELREEFERANQFASSK